MYKKYIGKPVLIIDNLKEDVAGVLLEVFKDPSGRVEAVKIMQRRKDNKSILEVIVPYPFKLKAEVSKDGSE